MPDVAQMWKKLFAISCFVATGLLSGCSTTLQSEVRIKHVWPSQMADKSYVFAPAAAAPTTSGVMASLPVEEVAQEYQLALDLLRKKLQGLGFQEVVSDGKGTPPHLVVALQYATQSQPVYQLEDVLFAPHSRYLGRHWGPGYVRGLNHAVYYGPYFGASYGPYIGPRLAPSLWYYPGFDPLWRSGPLYVYRESAFPQFQRQLRILIEQFNDHKKLFEAHVANDSRSDAIERVLPFMLDSALNGFPGQDGSVRQFEVKFD